MGARTLGLLGGTFDPVHHGHLRLAIECQERLALDEVRLLPARQPNLRDEPRAGAGDRLAMLEVAVHGTPLKVDSRELTGTGVTYTVETLSTLRQEDPAVVLCFILGQDAFNRLPSWHRWRELLALAHLVVATRPGCAAPEDASLRALLLAARVPDVATLKTRPAGGILLQDIPLLPIAATELRAKVRAGRSLTGLTPPAVVDYIQTRGLYRQGER